MKKRREQVLSVEDRADGTSIGRKCKTEQQPVQANQETGNYWQVMLSTAAERYPGNYLEEGEKDSVKK